jgi:hypothetical protein
MKTQKTMPVGGLGGSGMVAVAVAEVQRGRDRLCKVMCRALMLQDDDEISHWPNLEQMFPCLQLLDQLLGIQEIARM